MAESKGFEPLSLITQTSCLAGRRFRPLSQLSVNNYFRGCANFAQGKVYPCLRSQIATPNYFSRQLLVDNSILVSPTGLEPAWVSPLRSKRSV